MGEKNKGLPEKKSIETKDKKITSLKSPDLLVLSAEVLKNLIDSELESLDLLSGELEGAISAILDEKEKEERTKEKNKLLKKIGNLKKLKNTDNKLRKIDDFKKELASIISEINTVVSSEKSTPINSGEDVEEKTGKQESKIYIEDGLAKEEAQKKMNSDLVEGLEDVVILNRDMNDRIDSEEHYYSRKAAKVTLNRIDDIEKLNAKTELERDEKFKEETKKILEDLVVHGRLSINKETGKIELLNKADLDCKAALGLLKMSGVDVGKVEYVAPGEIKEGKINIDTGNKEGLHILEDGTVIIDHHGEDSDNNTSAARRTYDMLLDLGLLKTEGNEYLENLVYFVDRVDNFNYPESYYKNYFKESWKTLFGLSKMLEWDELNNFFKYKDPKTEKSLDPAKPLSEGLLRKFGFIKKIKDKEVGKSLSHKERVEKSKIELEKMEKEGLIIESDRYGKICLNINGRINGGIDAARAFGCDTFLAWNSGNNNFFISSLVGKNIEDNFEDGKNIRKTMWINQLDNERNVTLKEIIEKMTDGKFIPSKEVEKVLNTNIEKNKEKKEKKGASVLQNEKVEASNEDSNNEEGVLIDLEHKDLHGIEVSNVEDLSNEQIAKNSTLSEAERIELASLIEEKLVGVDSDYDLLMKKFHDFREKNKEEVVYNKDIFKKTLDIHEKKNQLRNKVKQETILTQEVLNELIELDKEIVVLLEENWDESLEKFKEGEVFTEKEEKMLESFKEIITQYIKKAKQESLSWNNFPQGRIDTLIEIHAVAFLMQNFLKNNLFKGKEEKVAEFIIKNRIN